MEQLLAKESHEATPFRANTSKLFPEGEPSDRYFVEFIQHLDTKRASGRSDNDIAREYTGESPVDFPKAKRLLARYRMARQRGQVGI